MTALKLLLVHVGMLSRLSFFEVMASKQQRASTKYFSNETVWFRGARASLAERDSKELIDEDFQLQAQLDRTIAAVLRVRAQALKTKVRLEKRDFSLVSSKQLIASSQALAAAATDLHDEVSAFKWAMLEHDADRAPRDEGWVASTPEDIRNLLAKI